MKFTDRELDIIINALDELYTQKEQAAERLEDTGLDGLSLLLEAKAADTLANRIKQGRVNY